MVTSLEVLGPAQLFEQRVPRASNRSGSSRRCDTAESDVAKALGRDAWLRLPPAVRRRFGEGKRTDRPQRYRGTMAQVECSRLGWLLAQAARLIGTPLAPFAGSNVPVRVVVTAQPGGAGECWERIYAFAGRREIKVTSYKRIDADGGFVECVGGGFGMALQLYERNGALHFESTSYFWDVAGWRLPLPALLSPGTAHVVHADLGRGLFRFTITITHPLLGQMFHQDGVFHEEGEDPWTSSLPC